MLEKIKRVLGKPESTGSNESIDSALERFNVPTSGNFFPKVSVVIPIYNGEADLPDLLRCLYAQTYPADLVEYMLVDNASQDNTAAVLKAASEAAQAQGITLHPLSENQIQSPSAARNAGIRAATGEIIAFTDVDCRPLPDWLFNLVQPFANSEVGLVVGEIEALPGKTLWERYAARKQVLCQKPGLMNRFAPYGASANLATRRQALEQVGLFRPYLTTAEDVDLCWRILKQPPWRLAYLEKAVVRHRHRSTLQGLQSQYQRYGRSYRYLHELYGVELITKLTSYQYLYLLSRWLLKESPINSVKVLLGQAKPIELLVQPIYLLTCRAWENGKRQAKLPEQARQIEWL